METVKVELQKLQLLNDRIAQTIDALNQLRLTTHGLQHTAAQQLGVAQYAQPYPQQHLGVPQVGFGAGVPMQAMQPQWIAGIGHTTQIPMQPQLLPQLGIGQQVGQFGQQLGQQPMFGAGGFGISHSVDPQWQARVAQTFPFVGYQFPPVISNY